MSTWHSLWSDEELTKRQKVFGAVVCNFFQKYVKREVDTVLDIGCGWGDLINLINAKDKFAIDLSHAMRLYVKREVRFCAASCCCMPWRDNSFDVIFASNIFEHLPKKEQVLVSIEECFRVLKRGGRLLILQPNFKYCSKEYFDFFDHHHAFTHLSIREALCLIGFEIREVFPRFLPFSSKQKYPKSALLVKAYLRFPLLWKLAGKQMFIMAQKP